MSYSEHHGHLFYIRRQSFEDNILNLEFVGVEYKAKIDSDDLYHHCALIPVVMEPALVRRVQECRRDKKSVVCSARLRLDASLPGYGYLVDPLEYAPRVTLSGLMRWDSFRTHLKL